MEFDLVGDTLMVSMMFIWMLPVTIAVGAWAWRKHPSRWDVFYEQNTAVVLIAVVGGFTVAFAYFWAGFLTGQMPSLVRIGMQFLEGAVSCGVAAKVGYFVVNKMFSEAT
jgi:hypothetical protein